LAGLDPPPPRVLLRLELAEADVPDLLLDGDQVADDLGRRPFPRGGRGPRRRAGRRAEGVRERRQPRANRSGVGHRRIVDRRRLRCDPRSDQCDPPARRVRCRCTGSTGTGRARRESAQARDRPGASATPPSIGPNGDAAARADPRSESPGTQARTQPRVRCRIATEAYKATPTIIGSSSKTTAFEWFCGAVSGSSLAGRPPRKAIAPGTCWRT